jgi:hypothetical protein
MIDKRDSAARDAWFYECQRRKIPLPVLPPLRWRYSRSSRLEASASK